MSNRRLFDDAFQHSHGRPNETRNNSRYNLPTNTLWFHIIPDIQFTVDDDPLIFVTNRKIKNKQVMTSRQLSLQTAHFLGLHAGDSFYWKEVNQFTGKVETHAVCFDGSGLDLSHESNLPSLVACAVETGLKGMRLLCYFAHCYSFKGYVQVFRGNKLLLTSEMENAYRDYVRHFPDC